MVTSIFRFETKQFCSVCFLNSELCCALSSLLAVAQEICVDQAAVVDMIRTSEPPGRALLPAPGLIGSALMADGAEIERSPPPPTTAKVSGVSGGGGGDA